MAKPEDVGLSSARLDRIGQVLRGDVEHGRMPGAVIAITRRGKLVYYESFGYLDKAAGTPMTKDAIFVLASMTKPMAAVAALILAERSELLLNDPVGNYLPALKDMKVATATGTEPARRQPTLQDMMRHTAGVTYGNQGTRWCCSRLPTDVAGLGWRRVFRARRCQFPTPKIQLPKDPVLGSWELEVGR